MDTRTGQIVEAPDGLMEQFQAQIKKAQEAEAKAGPPAEVPGLVPIPKAQLERVKKMSKDRRKAWAKAEFERRVERKRQRRARKANRKGKSK